MPMYLDRHDAPEISAEELAAAHEADLREQGNLDVCYHTYWFDQQRGSVFCLAEGPSQEAVEEVHSRAHGAMASSIIEIGPTAPLDRYFGPLPDHPPGTAYTDSALRAIVFTDVRGSVAQTQALTRRYARRQVGWFRRYNATRLAYDDPARHQAALALVMGED